jgi:hypothetical protein
LSPNTAPRQKPAGLTNDLAKAGAGKLGLEGIVSKRKDSAYRSGRSPDWLKMKNADAPAVKARSRGRLGKGSLAMSVAPESGRNRIMIYGPKSDSTYVRVFGFLLNPMQPFRFEGTKKPEREPAPSR